MADEEQIARIRATAYEKLQADPSGPNAGRLREILSTLPKVAKTRDPFADPGAGRAKPPEVHGELASGDDFGAELPQTPDEQLGLDKGPQAPGLGERALITVTDPHKRREFERGVDDMVAFGAGQKLARAAERISGTPGEGGFTEEGERLDAQRAGGYRQGGQLLGSIIPGGARAIGQMSGSMAGRLVSPIAAAGSGGRAAAGMLGGAAANTIANPLIAGGQAAVRGDNPIIDISNAFKNDSLPNAIVGGAVGLPVGLAAGIHGSHTQAGRDIRLAESYGATPTPFGGAKGGVFDSRLLSGVEGSTREAGSMARRAGREVLGGLEGEQAGLSKEYAAAKQLAGDQGFLEGRVRPDYVRDEAQKLLRGERLTAGQKAAVESEVNAALERHPGGMTVEDFNDFRAKIGDIFGTGPGEAAHPALDRIRQAAKRSVDETEMGPINERYHKGTESLNKKYEQLGISRDSEPRIQEKSVAGTILRRGENTPTAGIQEPAIEEFLQANPQYRPMFDSVSLLNAKDRMGASLQSHGGTLYTRMHGALHHNLEPLQVGAYRLGMGLDDKGVAATLAAKLLLGQMNEGQ